MSHHNYPNHGRPFRPSPSGGNPHGGSSYTRQGRFMDLPDRHQSNDFPAEAQPHNPFYHSIPHQPYNHAPQNAWVPPAPGHGQPEGHREDIPPPVGGVAGPGRVQDPHRIDMAHQGIVGYRPQPIANPTYIFPDAKHAQGIQAQVQPNALVGIDYMNQDHIPTPNQPRPEDLRQLASRYWYHPTAQIGMVSVEAGTTGQYEVVITLETPIRF
ncbi:hypothetical protein F5888DRAFT_1753289 [Russula emetica]|nr:hypothetical protein F5888DRAFT_1753289 [Russula emetica]